MASRNPLNVNAHGRSGMSPRADVPAEALFGPINQQPDDVPEWAQGQTFEPAEPIADLIRAMYPGAKPYRPRGGENDGE